MNSPSLACNFFEIITAEKPSDCVENPPDSPKSLRREPQKKEDEKSQDNADQDGRENRQQRTDKSDDVFDDRQDPI